MTIQNENGRPFILAVIAMRGLTVTASVLIVLRPILTLTREDLLMSNDLLISEIFIHDGKEYELFEGGKGVGWYIDEGGRCSYLFATLENLKHAIRSGWNLFLT